MLKGKCQTISHPEYSKINHMETDMSGLFKMLQLKVKRNKKGLLVNTKTHSYQLEIEDV
jgi:hypothetical protein